MFICEEWTRPACAELFIQSCKDPSGTGPVGWTPGQFSPTSGSTSPADLFLSACSHIFIFSSFGTEFGSF